MIEVKNIEKSFGESKVLKGVSTIFETGKTNLIIGQSGSGKTVMLKSLLGILNSTLMNWYFSNCFVDYNIKPKYLEQLPLPINIGSQELDGFVESLINAKSVNIDADTTGLEHQIDQLIYKLYDLTEEEIRIIEGS